MSGPVLEQFLQQVPLLLGVLGHRILDPLTGAVQSNGLRKLVCAVKEAKAFGTITDEGLVVLKGSTALKGTTESMIPGWVALKQELLASGKLVEKGELLVFTDDVLFNSPSAAAAVVYGNNANGRVLWKTEDGRTLKEIEESESR
jgi:hypothetical protein